MDAQVSARSKYRRHSVCSVSAILKSCCRCQQRSIKPAIDPEKKPRDVRSAFLAQIESMAQAFDEAGAASGPTPDIRYANVLTVARPRQSLDLIVTSPPYVTSYEYADRSEEHTSELQSLMRISYAVFCLQQKTQTLT